MNIAKILTSVSRVLVGCLFIFSGLIKSNDPKGTGIKFNEYFDVFAASQKQVQDTIHVMVKGIDLDINDFVSFNLSPNDTAFKLEFNQATPGKMYFEDEADSLYGSMLYVLKNNEEIFSYFIPFSDSTVLDRIIFQARVAGSNNQKLVDTTLFINQNSKYEIAENIPVNQFIKKENFLVGFFTGMKDYSLSLSIIMCILEVILGFAILIGWQPKLMSWLILLMIVFFTFLTWYSAYYNKVTDCGCFGDFIKLKPWTSFFKDVVLLFFILIIFFRRSKIIPLFSPLFSINAMIVVTLASTVFAIYSNMFLPAWDFLPFKEGANIRAAMTAPKGVREVDSFVNVLVYKKGDKIDSFVFPKMPPDNSWTFVNRVDKLVAEGWKSPIHGFSFDKRDELDIDLKDTLLYSKGFHLLIVSAHLEDANDAAWEKVRQLAQGLANTGIQVHAVTSSSLELADKFCSDKQLPFRFRNADETLLKTVIRSNPGIMLWHDGFVLEKWSCRSVPSAEKIVKVSKKRK